MSGMKYQWRVACATILCIAALALISQVSDGNVALAPVDVDSLPLAGGVKGTRQLQAESGSSSSSAAEKGQGNQSSGVQASAGSLGTGSSMPSGKASKNQRIPVLNTIYVITPTYSRLVQKAELTRLCHTFRLVPKIHWIVVEDSENKTDLVARLLENCRVSYTHLNAHTPEKYRLSNFKSRHQVPRGVAQRNAGLDWLQAKFTNGTKIVPEARGVVYFGDDDNTYDLQLFDEMRDTKRVSAWPVAFVGGILVEKPIIGPDGKIQKWNSIHKPERPYPIDMAGFAINLRLLLRHPSARFTYKAKLGYQESIILDRVGVPIQEFEVKADDATKIYVWHTRSEAPVTKWEKDLEIPSNKEMEL